ncbi:MAG: Gfo/Idh/MocA family oxidoreductase, partial [Phycisphaerales bacterium]|nr:Gfo/Idh/MocA family oxidoreductase [Phycisphaerales bacterium]
MPNRRDFMIHSGSAVAAMAILPSEVLARTVGFAAPVNVGIIGVGRQGRSMLAELQKFSDVTIKAICDTYPARLSAGERRARGATAYADHRELLDKGGCDAVIIATPTHLHKQIAIDAMQAGKHVYCEGPLAHTVEDCVEIAQAARAHDKVFQVGLQGRANPVYTLAWTFYRSDSVRDNVLMRGQAARKTSWRFPVSDSSFEKAMNWRLDPAVSLGLAGEWGTQQFDVFHWYRSRYPTRVSGSGTIQLHKDGREIADTITA